MAKRQIKILVACGSGIATSTVAADGVKALAAAEGVDAQVIKCGIQEIPLKQNDVDIVTMTTNYKGQISKPSMSIFGLISGINEDQIKKDLAKLMHEAEESE